jgi:predicted dehydrogenase
MSEHRAGTDGLRHGREAICSRQDVASSGGDAHSGGFILDVGVDDLDTPRSLLEKDPQMVYARGSSPVYPGTDLRSARGTVESDNAASGALRRGGRWTVPQAAGSRAAPSRP